jgi:hypothetical protein
MTGYSVCGQFVGVGARWHYRWDKGNDCIVRQWWPDTGVWGELQEYGDRGFIKVPEENIRYLYPAQSDTLQ